MAIIKAYALPHPPLAVPEVGRGQEKKISKTLDAFYEVSEEVARIKPETIVFITPHNTAYADYFHISPGIKAFGDFSRFNAAGVRLETSYDTEMVEEISYLSGISGISAGVMGERDKKLDHGVTVPMWFINQKYTDYKVVRISQSGLAPSEHYKLGKLIAEAAERKQRSTVLVASSDMSHKLALDGPYGFATEGPQFDAEVIRILADNDYLSLMKIPESTRERAAECGYNSLMVMAGCFDRRRVDSKVLSYEGPYGVGYAIASFTPGETDERRNFLEQFESIELADVNSRRDTEDQYRALARQSLEYTVKNGDNLPVPTDLPDEMLNNRAGVFVSLHKLGRLRGCIGTITPTATNIAQEIIRNAVSAGLKDPRFDPVTVAELVYLTYKVDILLPAELISGPEELDVKRYGVIVSSGYKRGLLLPNLDGVDTVEDQISIASNKAGIPEGTPVKLERFEVIRHE